MRPVARPVRPSCAVNDPSQRFQSGASIRHRRSTPFTSFNRDIPQAVVRRIFDHGSAQMTGHYARLHDTTVRRQREGDRKVDIHCATITFDQFGPIAQAAWAKQRLGQTTQALPNGYCGLPVQQSSPHANACLACPMFLTTGEFLPQHRQQRQQTCS